MLLKKSLLCPPIIANKGKYLHSNLDFFFRFCTFKHGQKYNAYTLIGE
jgi:hypothetical protein